jgi:CheY-like chemotaxis protein
MDKRHDERSARAPPSRRVLLVEDNPDGRETLHLLLEAYGYDVVTAADGGQGVRQGLAHRPDVAIVDIGLPVLDGYAVARSLRAALGGKLFLIALTAYTRPEDRRQSREAGFDVHLGKPADFQDLLRLLAAEATRRC